MNKDYRFQLRITNNMDECIKRLADKKGMTKCDYVRYIIQMHLDSFQSDNASSTFKQVGV